MLGPPKARNLDLPVPFLRLLRQKDRQGFTRLRNQSLPMGTACVTGIDHLSFDGWSIESIVGYLETVA